MISLGVGTCERCKLVRVPMCMNNFPAVTRTGTTSQASGNTALLDGLFFLLEHLSACGEVGEGIPILKGLRRRSSMGVKLSVGRNRVELEYLNEGEEARKMRLAPLTASNIQVPNVRGRTAIL